MAKPEGGGGTLMSWSSLAMMLIGAYVYIAGRTTLDSSRPKLEGPPVLRLLEDREAWARLWQDPLQAVSKGVEAPGDPAGRAAAGRATLERIQKEYSDAGSVLILPVMISSEPYAEAAESRLRCRYAVLSGIQAAGYIPERQESIRYLSLASDGLPGSGVVPYEWCAPDPNAIAQTRHDPGPDKVLVLWIPETPVASQPLAGIQAIIRLFALDSPLRVRIIGPSTSSLLPRMLDEAEAGDWQDWTLFLDRATAWPKLIQSSRAVKTTEFKTDQPIWTSPGGFQVLRVIGTDLELSKRLVWELDKRGAVTRDETRHLVLIAEWDTAYARGWKNTLTSVVRAQGPEPENLHFYTYLRGLDGLTGDDDGGKHAASKDEEGSAKSVSPPSEAPAGRSQMDYVRRLEESLRQLRSRIKKQGLRHEIAAIGIVGSDLYDKLVLLKALKGSFPWVNFFTSDLDARLVHPDELPWTRSLIVASHFDLQLDAPLQAGVPPFRDCYQTATFLACQIALTASSPLKPERLPSLPPVPRSYQISRTGTYDLTIPDAADTLHPPTRRLDVLEGLVRLVLFPAGLLLIIGYLLFPLAHNWFIHDLAQEPLDLKLFRLSCCLLVVFMISVAINGALTDGEPFLVFGGISTWPTQLIRLLAFCLCGWFLRLGYRKAERNARHMEAKFPVLPKSPERPAPIPFCLWKFATLRREFSITYWPSVENDDVGSLWRRYRELSSIGSVAIRCIPNVIVFFGFFLLVSGSDPVTRLGRGQYCRSMDLGLDVTLFFLGSGLMFVVVDATRLCKQWIAHLSALQPAAAARGVGDLCSFELLKIRLIADRSAEIGQLMYFPFTILFLLLLARNSIFDSWNWSISLALTYGLCVLGSVYCGALLRYSAEQARRRALGKLRARLVQSLLDGSAGKEDYKAVLEDIEANRKGAFCPMQENPVIHAVLIPFGGMGTLELLKLVPILF